MIVVINIMVVFIMMISSLVIKLMRMFNLMVIVMMHLVRVFRHVGMLIYWNNHMVLNRMLLNLVMLSLHRMIEMFFCVCWG